MAVEDKKRMVARADIFKALGHPARLAMVVALGDMERCVCELQALVGSDMSTVSKHLTVLRHAGLVEAEKRGKELHCSVRYGAIARTLRAIADAIEACCPDDGEDE